MSPPCGRARRGALPRRAPERDSRWIAAVFAHFVSSTGSVPVVVISLPRRLLTRCLAEHGSEDRTVECLLSTDLTAPAEAVELRTRELPRLSDLLRTRDRAGPGLTSEPSGAL